AELDIVNNSVVNADDGMPRIELPELARIVYFRPDTLPPGFQPELMATRHFVPREYPFAFTNGIQASWLEVDTQAGFIKLLKHWVVEDCGTIINPQLVDEQIRGGVVQGLGAALFEKCIYDERGQLTNANLADYLVPMSGEMPDIDVGHVVSPTAESELGAKGAGEAGTAGAAGGEDAPGRRGRARGAHRRGRRRSGRGGHRPTKGPRGVRPGRRSGARGRPRGAGDDEPVRLHLGLRPLCPPGEVGGS